MISAPARCGRTLARPCGANHAVSEERTRGPEKACEISPDANVARHDEANARIGGGQLLRRSNARSNETRYCGSPAAFVEREANAVRENPATGARVGWRDAACSRARPCNPLGVNVGVGCFGGLRRTPPHTAYVFDL